MTATTLEVVVQIAAAANGIPAEDYLVYCAETALGGCNGEIVIRVVSEAESAELNSHYRDKPGATNVLAFPPEEALMPGMDAPQLGDIAICAAVVEREALEQGKPVASHWAHMVVHGCLHLLGYDHMTAGQASTMEARERELLEQLEISDPYAAEA